MNTSLNILFAFLLLVVISSSCRSNKSDEPGKEITDTDTTKKDDNIASVTEGQMRTVGIELGTIEEHNLTKVIRANGRLIVPPQNKAVVNALVGGVIKRINVSEGEEVKKGQTVVSIENPDFIKLQQDYLTSKDNIVFLSQEFERQKTLHDADAGIGKVYQQSSANYTAEQSRLKSLEAQLRQIHINPSRVTRENITHEIPVTAPIAGTVGKINLSIGTFTDASSPIMEIVNNRDMHCDLRIFENDITKVKVGQNVRLTVNSLNDKQVTGKVFGINKSLEQENKSVVVHALVNSDATSNLIDGMYVTALIESGKEKVPAVPRDAIVKVAERSFIFVLKDTLSKYRFKMTEVVPGVEELGFVQITVVEEVPPGARIAIKGAFYIWSGMQTTETDDM